MRTVVACVLLFASLGACVAPPGGIKVSPTRGDLQGYRAFSWGKANVSYEEYDDAAATCSIAGVFARADWMPVDHLVNTVEDVHTLVDQQARAELKLRQRVIDQCLLESGFTRFGLTAEQIARLETLERGAPERRRYLHRIGSDPAVLQAQGLGAPPQF